jgi:branched-chain amino acid transport system substrate-binding protein
VETGGGRAANQGDIEMNVKSIAAKLATGLVVLGGLMASAGGQTLKIGTISPLTGSAAAWGMAVAEGVKILAADINAQGGLDVEGKKHKIEVISYDDKYKAADAVAAYNRLVTRDGIKYVFVMSSASSMAIKASVESDKVLALTTAVSSKIIDPTTKQFFRISSTTVHFVPALVSWMKENTKERRLYIVNPNDEPGWDQDKLSKAAFSEKGFQVLGTELFDRSQQDFQSLVTKILGTKPDLIDLGVTSPATAGLFVRQARELGYTGRFVQTGAAAGKEILEGAGAKAAEGLITILYADEQSKGYQELAAKYKKSVGQAPNPLIVSYYDGAKILVRAIQKAGNIEDAAKVADAFGRALPMDSVQGDPMTLGQAAGVPRQVMDVKYVGQIRSGETVVIGKIK